MPLRSNFSPPRDLALVSTGLDLEGGGRALVGRLLARAGADWARARGARFDVFALGQADPDLIGPIPGRVRAFSAPGKTGFARLAAAAVALQLRPRRPALLFDLLGPARIQTALPAAFRSSYLLCLLGIEAWRPLSSTRQRALDGATIRLAISRYTLARAREIHPGLSAEILPLALEERPPTGVADRALLDRVGDGFALIAGRMDASERYKGHDALLEALLRVPEARLVIAGGGNDRSRLEAKAAALGLVDRVLFTGFVTETTLAALYDRSALLAMPSRGEGFGLVYLEAMRAGRPCLAARGSAADEVVLDGETGRLVDPDDRDELATALAHLLDSPETALRMGAAGKIRWQREFGYPRFQDRLAGHLDRLTGRRPEPREA
ncbi:MAG TPA: glycosyltransferase family 4 protein [Thermoanaerobaculia bacterium]|jgi:phosphatidylinositol alpha-1,6-mannosyltransferase|nr:glycosyltransferase family 4 protein [Thermoanaerobaculia bacterium]